VLKKRIIPTFLFKNNRLVKGVNFSDYRDIGEPKSNIKIFNSQKTDEIIFINIDKKKNINNLCEILKDASKYCFMPLAAGGGVSSMNDIKKLLKSGADKVSINSKILEDISFLKKASKEFGSQCVVVGLDIKKINGKYSIMRNNGKKFFSSNILEYMKKCRDLGAGEFFINNIDLDGTRKGYDINLAKKIELYTDLPIIFSGGAKNFDDLYKLFKNTKNTAAAGMTLFCFGDNSPIRARSYLRNRGIKVKQK
tara:strand:- start:9668 stop:10423 length:756 start_codon:yes stop_codon:yes gene_type:complete